MLFLQARGNICMCEELSLFSKCFSWSNAHNGKFVVAFKKSMQPPLASEVTVKDLDQCFLQQRLSKELNACFSQTSKE